LRTLEKEKSRLKAACRTLRSSQRRGNAHPVRKGKGEEREEFAAPFQEVRKKDLGGKKGCGGNKPFVSREGEKVVCSLKLREKKSKAERKKKKGIGENYLPLVYPGGEGKKTKFCMPQLNGF